MNKSIIIILCATSLIFFGLGWYFGVASTWNEAEFSNTPESAMLKEGSPPIPPSTPTTSAASIANGLSEQTGNFESLELNPSKQEMNIEQLEAQNALLQKQLTEQKNKADQKYARLESHYKGAQTLLEQQGLKHETISLDDAQKYVPSPFSDSIARSSGTVVEQFKKLHTMEPDYEWGEQMQQRISDFIVTHELSNQIQLQSVICKQNLCEIRAFQAEDKLVTQIMSAMSAQPWWDFNSTHSSSANNDEHGKYVYVMATKTETIPTPN